MQRNKWRWLCLAFLLSVGFACAYKHQPPQSHAATNTVEVPMVTLVPALRDCSNNKYGLCLGEPVTIPIERELHVPIIIPVVVPSGL